LRAKPRHDVAGLTKTLALAEPILAGLGFSSGRAATIEADDPDALGAALRVIAAAEPAPRPASFCPSGGARSVRLALRELHRVAPAPADVVALPAGARWASRLTSRLHAVSRLRVRMSTGALIDDPERRCSPLRKMPACSAGCARRPARAGDLAQAAASISRAATASARILKRRSRFPCIRCGKPFGVKSTIERVVAKLEGKHWMFEGQAARLDALKDVRGLPGNRGHRSGLRSLRRPPRPNVRTTEDYLRERKELKSRRARRRHNCNAVSLRRLR